MPRKNQKRALKTEVFNGFDRRWSKKRSDNDKGRLKHEYESFLDVIVQIDGRKPVSLFLFLQ